MILITGGAGYIGSILTEYLLNYKFDVIVVDDLSNGNIHAVSDGVIFYKNNFGDKELLNKIFKQYPVEFVIHLAASANVPDSVINPYEYYNNNLTNSLNLIKCMVDNQVNNIIYASTAAVYGNPIEIPISEEHPTITINPYGTSKLQFEHILHDFNIAYGIRSCVFRFFCAAGATNMHGEARSNETHLIPLVIDTLLGNRENICVYGNTFNTADGTGVRDFLHVSDIANAIICAVNNFTVAQGQIFNLGTETGYSVLEVLSLAQELFKQKIKYSICNPRPGDPAVLVASNKKAQKILNWNPMNSLKDILISSHSWQKNRKY